MLECAHRRSEGKGFECVLEIPIINAEMQLQGVDNEESSEARGDLDSGLMEKSSAAALELALSSFSCLLGLYLQLDTCWPVVSFLVDFPLKKLYSNLAK